MEDHEENVNWFSSLIGFFYDHGIGVSKIDKNKSLEYYLLAINIKNDKKLISVYQILNIIIAKHLLSFHYYKDIILNKKNLISKKVESLENIHVTSQIQYENFNGLEINLYKDEIITIENYFESLDKSLNDDEIGYCYQYGIGIEKDEKKAFECYLKAANEGNIHAQYNLGICHQNGIGVSKDDEKAFEWYFKSAEGELSIAQSVLGNCYQNGTGTKKDKNKAFEYYLNAAKRENSNTYIKLGDCYRNRNSIRRNDYKAYECYLRAVNRGNSDAANNLGDLYKSGFGRSLNEAFNWYQKAAKNGNRIAQYNLGNCYRFGNGVYMDLSKAFEFYKISANNGYVNAQFALGYCYSNGIGTVPNTERAYELYKMAAEKGHNDAQYNLLLYPLRKGDDKAEKKLFETVKTAAEKECLESQYLLGYYYSHGIGTEINKEKALELYKMAAKRNHSMAQNNLGDLYKNDKFFKKAFYWYDKAAEDNDNMIAQYNIGQCYELGIGIDKNYFKAFCYYENSYKLDYLESYFQLGYFYINGLGTKINRKKGFQLYNKAAGKNKNFNILSYYKKEKEINNVLDKVIYEYYKAAGDDNKDALCKLGEIYELGKGVCKNKIRAFAFYKKAAEKGSINAKHKLKTSY
ncbi:Sel1-like repeat protein [Rhizophagus clarus]|uniref:Sel1-like repeat protein n=1 Tax=Rhizophagus clarus TaxID=94130 RepID=A0A8H3LU82_9GLOM|nr:Sel1-like repeat protein [Rhizophagus clarus]